MNDMLELAETVRTLKGHLEEMQAENTDLWLETRQLLDRLKRNCEQARGHCDAQTWAAPAQPQGREKSEH